MKITFIGPRLQDLGGFAENPLHMSLKSKIASILDDHKQDILITSASIGIEYWSAKIALEKKIKYEIYVPFKKFDEKWPKNVRLEYNFLLKKAQKKVSLSDSFFDYKLLMQKDIRLINDADVVYSAYNILPALLKKFLPGKNVIDICPGGEQDDFYTTF